MTDYTLRIGSRKSELALKQTYIIERLLKEAYPDLKTKIITSDTLGDKTLQAFAILWWKGCFRIRIRRSPFKWTDRPGSPQCQGQCLQSWIMVFALLRYPHGNIREMYY